MTTPLPDEKTERTRTLLISGIVVLALVVLGLGAWAIFRPKPKPAGQVAFTPAEETSTSVSSTSSALASQTASAATGTPDNGGNASPSTTATAPVRVAKVAFRLGNGIFVADEDGSNAVQVVAQADPGAMFSLSPDAATLALVSGDTTKTLSLIDVATGSSVRIPNATDLPDWAPDSSWVAYTAGSAGSLSIRRVDRDGVGDALVAVPGADPVVSPDGAKIAYAQNDPTGPTDPLYVVDLTTQTTKQVPASRGAVHWAWASDGSLYFVQPGKSAGGGIVGVADPSLVDGRTIGSIPTVSQAGGPGELYPSPDGTRLLLTRVGDDGYSRMLLLTVKSGTVSSLATRRDAYPLGWSLDGKHILFIEGNAFQGEATALYRMNPDGTQRLMVVGGAGS